jgi:hypothetical protein
VRSGRGLRAERVAGDPVASGALDAKFRNVTDTLITTEGPMETPDPAFEVTKVPTGGKTYRIAMRAFCGSSGSNRKRVVELRLNFRETLIKPLGADQPRAQ